MVLLNQRSASRRQATEQRAHSNSQKVVRSLKHFCCSCFTRASANCCDHGAQSSSIGSKVGIRSWFGKGLEIKGAGSGASTRQKALHTLSAASAVSRSIQNATDLASDCSLNLRYSSGMNMYPTCLCNSVSLMSAVQGGTASSQP